MRLWSLTIQPSKTKRLTFREPILTRRLIIPDTPLALEDEGMVARFEGMNWHADFIDQVFHLLAKDILEAPGITTGNTLTANAKAEKQAGGYALSVDVKQFSPEELSVKVAGRKLQVLGKFERRTEDFQGSLYQCEEFGKEYELPADVSPGLLTCSLSKDGQLHIKAPQRGAGSERVVPINFSTSVTVNLQPSQGKEEGKKESSNEE
uniref:SHSP domain-containing protein n=2 Tax=Latimeria chalumnae TaxID=7897 RepID=H3ARE0_LATCH